MGKVICIYCKAEVINDDCSCFNREILRYTEKIKEIKESEKNE